MRIEREREREREKEREREAARARVLARALRPRGQVGRADAEEEARVHHTYLALGMRARPVQLAAQLDILLVHQAELVLKDL